MTPAPAPGTAAVWEEMEWAAGPGVGGLKAFELQGAGEGIDRLEGTEGQAMPSARHLFQQRLARSGWRLHECRGTAPKFCL